MQPRWPGDDRGLGIADDSRVAEGLEELEGLARIENWVAESPEVHLLPHLRRACEEASSMFTLASSETDDRGAFVVRLRCRDRSAGRGQIRAAIYALIGHVAETASYVRQRTDPLTFEVLTGIPAGEGPFASHGHLLLLMVV